MVKKCGIKRGNGLQPQSEPKYTVKIVYRGNA
nr:MAG TPA: hypothetical protein [Caudoviricetes sp.]